ncbi:MAG TPA: tyrosine-type recombinase/integrase [Burkholderiales bacterium]|nr:tyrosine-type recombinase/integrase [Burkholderiales bacterium]
MTKRIRWTEMDKSTTPFRELRKAFAVYNQTTNKSPATVRWYDFRLELFERWLGATACLADVTINNARAYIAELQNRTTRHGNNPYFKVKDGSLSSSYIQGFARTLRAFASWLHADGYTDTNVLKPMKPPKIRQEVVEPLTDDEVRNLTGSFDRDEPFGFRNLAIIWTILDCGLRASELCGLSVENAHLDQGFLKILGKGNKERLVPIGNQCQETLLRWRDRFRPQFDVERSETLFLNANGDALTVSALEEVVKRAGKKAGVPRTQCHLLRHTFATTYLVKEIGDALRLQQILGHTSLEMVRRYVALSNVQRSLIERRASPMDLIAQPNHRASQARRVQPQRRRRGLRVVK